VKLLHPEVRAFVTQTHTYQMIYWLGHRNPSSAVSRVDGPPRNICYATNRQERGKQLAHACYLVSGRYPNTPIPIACELSERMVHPPT